MPQRGPSARLSLDALVAGLDHRQDGALVLTAKGKAPSDCSPLTFVQGDLAYEIEVEIEVDPGVTAGLILFYDRALYAGLGFDAARFVTHVSGYNHNVRGGFMMLRPGLYAARNGEARFRNFRFRAL